MQMTNSKTSYGLVPQAVHWLTVIFIVVGWLLGNFMDDFPKSARPSALFVHMTLGQCVIALLVLRLGWRIADPPPPLEQTRFGPVLEKLARLSHYVLYALLLAVPSLGIVLQLKRGNVLPIAGVWNVASPWPADRAIARLLLRAHEYLADALIVLAGVHAAAALTHHWIFGDRTLARMLPGRGERWWARLAK